MSRGVVSNEDNGPQSGSCFNRLLSLCQNKSIGWVGLGSHRVASVREFAVICFTVVDNKRF